MYRFLLALFVFTTADERAIKLAWIDQVYGDWLSADDVALAAGVPGPTRSPGL